MLNTVLDVREPGVVEAEGRLYITLVEPPDTYSAGGVGAAGTAEGIVRNRTPSALTAGG